MSAPKVGQWSIREYRVDEYAARLELKPERMRARRFWREERRARSVTRASSWLRRRLAARDGAIAVGDVDLQVVPDFRSGIPYLVLRLDAVRDDDGYLRGRYPRGLRLQPGLRNFRIPVFPPAPSILDDLELEL